MQLGFVIDHGRCIGCHACTVACKSENEVPVGSFRTWVKYTERGQFPAVKRSFAVLRCNQCTDAPCVTICPVRALEKRPDGVVDVDHRACIGCKSCMQACPYDALYINEDSGTAEKCHFCVHRTERGLAPACAVVCPTEAIIPGDFDDPNSRVAQLKAAGLLSLRKTEAGTGPNVGYLEADPAGLVPSETSLSAGFLWANQQPGLTLDAETWRASVESIEARTTYDVQHKPLWGWKVWSYLFTKSIAAGLLLVTMVLMALPGGTQLRSGDAAWLGTGALVALALTAILLIADLKRPGRFHTILLRPQWDSWLTKGSVILMLYGLTLALCTGGWLLAPAELDARDAVPLIRVIGTAILAALTAVYTAWLFAQAKARVLWMKRGFALQLLGQAVLAGSATAILLVGWRHGAGFAGIRGVLNALLLGGIAIHGACAMLEKHLAPRGRKAEYARVVALLHKGPLGRQHTFFLTVLTLAVPLVGVLLATNASLPAGARLACNLVGAASALVGLYGEERLFIRAGQALPLH